MFDQIETTIVEINTIKQAVSISLAHLNLHSNSILKSIDNAIRFSTSLTEQTPENFDWKNALQLAEKIPIHKALLSGHSNSTLLSDWINRKEIESTSQSFESQRTQVTTKINDISERSDEMIKRVESLKQNASSWIEAPFTPVTIDKELEAVLAGNDLDINCNWKAYNDIYEDIATLVQKIQSDCNFVATLSDTPKNINNALRILQLHERDFLSKTLDLATELYNIHKCWAQSKVYNVLKSIFFLRTISSIQFFSSPLRTDVNELGNLIKTAESKRIIIARAIDMPYLYGALLFELIRRDEWMSQMKTLVGQTAELLATWRDSEIRRRNKWIRQLGGSLGMLKRIGGGGPTSGASSLSPTRDSTTLNLGEDSNVPDVEITIINSKDSVHFNLSRTDIIDYLALLKELGLVEEFEELEKLVSKTDKINFFPKPSIDEEDQHQQGALHRKSLFKEGNLSEYSKSLLLGKSILGSKAAFAQKNTDNIENKSTNNDALQTKIQAYEARIRKLEDLLHRNQFRESWTNKVINSSTPQNPSTPESNGIVATNNSNKHNAQTSSTSDVSINTVETSSELFTKEEHDSLLAKIAKLEADVLSQKNDLESARDTHLKLNQELDTHKNDLTEAQMMKSDLMANLFAKEGEFNSERRSLRKEIEQLKVKVDGLEIELETEAENTVLLEEELQKLENWKTKAQDTIKLLQRERQKFIKYKTESREHYRTLLVKERKRKRREEKKVLNSQMKYDVLYSRAKDLSQRLFTSTIRSSDLLECLGLQVSKVFDESDGSLVSFKIQRVKGLGRRARSALSAQTSGANFASASSPDNEESSNIAAPMSPSSETEENAYTNMTLGPLAITSGNGIMVGPQQDLMKTININPSVFYWMDPRGSSDEEESTSLDADSEVSDEGDDGEFDEYEDDYEEIQSIDESELKNDKTSTDELRHSIESSSLLGLPVQTDKSKASDTINDIKKNDDPISTVSSSSISAISAVSKLSTTSIVSQEQRKKLKREEMINNGVIKPTTESRQLSFIEDINIPVDKIIPTKDVTHFKKEYTEKQTKEEKKVEDQKLLEKYRRRASTRIETRYHRFLNCVYMDYDIFRDSVCKRFLDVEQLARKLQREVRGYRERAHFQEMLSRSKIAFQNFKPGDLALFLPTRDQNREPNPWAAFNVGAPHYFLKQKSEFRLKEREWLVARISKIEERVVDRAKVSDSLAFSKGKGKPSSSSSKAESEYNDNPFDLSDGLRWHLLDAVEERFSS